MKEILTISRMRQKIILPIALTLSCCFGIAVHSKPIQIGSQSNVNTIEGQSGGNINSRGCGFVSERPSQVIEVKERINNMRVSVTTTSGGQPTLLIEGPNGSLCSMNPEPEIAGVWVPGSYEIYVGDRRTNSRHPYTLIVAPNK